MKKITIIMISMTLLKVSKAQTDSTKPTSPVPTITGLVDMYYRCNISSPKQLSYKRFFRICNEYK